MLKWKYSYIDATNKDIRFRVIDNDDYVHMEYITDYTGQFAIRKCEIFGLKC